MRMEGGLFDQWLIWVTNMNIKILKQLKHIFAKSLQRNQKKYLFSLTFSF